MINQRKLLDESFFVNNTTKSRERLNLWQKDFIVTELFEYIGRHPEIKILDLGDCKLDENDVNLIAVLLENNKSITTLMLYSNKMGDEGACALASMLAINVTLTELNLCKNEIGVKGVRAFAEMLKTNSTLTSLDISENSYGNEGLKLVADALKSNIFLTELDVRGMSWRCDDNNRHTYNIDNEIDKNIVWKQTFPNQFAEKVITVCQGARQTRNFFNTLHKDILFYILNLASGKIRSADSVVAMCSLVYDNVVLENRPLNEITWKKTNANGKSIFQTKQTLFFAPIKTFLDVLKYRSLDPESCKVHELKCKNF